MKTTKVCALVLIMALSAFARAKWIYVATSQGTIVLYDANSIKRRGPIVRVWEKWVPIGESNRQRRAESLSMKNYAYQMEQSDYDCEKKRMRSVGVIIYSIDGHVIDSSENVESWETIVPDSAGSAVLEAVCRKQRIPRNSAKYGV
ncbi:MAG: surface-adhesin E family protein [Pyrinomonadaceae bacterium]